MADENKEPWTLLKREDYAFRWRWAGADHRGMIHWEVHKIAGTDDKGTIYAVERHSDSMEALKTPSYAPIEDGHIMHGTTKFDGCNDIQQTRTDCMMHFCSSSTLIAIAQDIHALGEVFLDETGSGWE